MVRIGIYLRISDDHDGEQTATERQRADCERYAAQKGWTVADVFTDIDLSAFKRKVHRPEFERMLASVREKRIDGVLAWKIDRITRRQRDLVRLDEACEEAGGFIATIVESIDTRQPTGRFVAELLVAQARMESENMRIRIIRKHQELAAAGAASLGGTRMYGLSADRRAVIADEVAFIREAVGSVFAGGSIRGICNDWRARCVVTPTGGPWQQQPLKRLLTSAALSGQREHNGTLTPGTWPAIIPPADTRRLRAILNDPARRTVVNARRYLLSSMVRCGRCGESMVARPTGAHVRRYVCARQPGNGNCGKTARVAEPVELFVREAVCIALDGADLREYVTQPTDATADLNDAIRADEEMITDLARDFAENRIAKREWYTARDVINARLEANRRQLAQSTGHSALQGVIGAGDEVRRQWEEHDLTWRRSILAAVIDHVVIDPAVKGRNVFDPSLVKIVWKF